MMYPNITSITNSTPLYKSIKGFIHSTPARLQTAYISDVGFDFVSLVRKLGLVLVPHIILLLFIARKDANFPYICTEKAL